MLENFTFWLYVYGALGNVYMSDKDEKSTILTKKKYNLLAHVDNPEMKEMVVTLASRARPNSLFFYSKTKRVEHIFWFISDKLKTQLRT